MKAKLQQAAIWVTLAILTGLAMVVAALSLGSGA